MPVLEELEDKVIVTDKKFPTNLIIEGDNYHALSVLNYTHQRKLDVIYIDPPYNTGNRDFKYNDQFVDKEDTYRHSKWLCFMYKRLSLARNLLTDKGVIFISIDDNEYANLKLLCDAIFGENNSIGPIIQNKLNAKNDTLNIQKNHEYILVYRNTEIKRAGKVIASLYNKKTDIKEVFKDGDEYFYLSDPITTRGEGGVLNKRKNLGYTIYYNPITCDFKGITDYDIELAKTSNNEQELYATNSELISRGYVCIRPPKVRGKLGAWTWECERFNSHLNEIFIKKSKGNKFSVNKKKFVNSSNVYEVDGKFFYNASSKVGNSKSIVEFSTNDGTDAYNQLLEAGTFNNPKNVDMLMYFISLFPLKDALVLDFFAGSGTTGHAIMQLNEEDGGCRKFILCTNNENKIAEEITYPRIKKIIEGYSGVKGIPANVRYFKTGFVSKSNVSDDTRNSLVRKSAEMICVRENTFEKVIEKDGFKIYRNENQSTGILFNLNDIDDFKNEITALNVLAHIYVFSLTSDNYDEDFDDLKLGHELCPIPESILEVYRKLFRE